MGATMKSSELHADATLTIPSEARTLIVCNDDSKTERLEALFEETGIHSETVHSLTAACEAARSGRFQAIFSTPLLGDGSWKRLVDLANYYDLGFEVVLFCSDGDLIEWGEAVEDGAFDVLHGLSELPKAAEVAKHALWTAYLKSAGRRPEPVSPGLDSTEQGLYGSAGPASHDREPRQASGLRTRSASAAS